MFHSDRVAQRCLDCPSPAAHAARGRQQLRQRAQQQLRTAVVSKDAGEALGRHRQDEYRQEDRVAAAAVSGCEVGGGGQAFVDGEIIVSSSEIIGGSSEIIGGSSKIIGGSSKIIGGSEIIVVGSSARHSPVQAQVPPSALPPPPSLQS